jgi:CDP-diacylglycerol---glycerol-3-phosphate 3-phosphatidyltransferase
MISVYNIKPRFQQLLRPVLTRLHGWGVSANAITLTAILLSAVTGWIIWQYHEQRWVFLVLPLALLLRMALNALDGMMARTYNMQSRLGEILNELGDVVSDICIFFPFVQFAFTDARLLFVFIILAVINEFAGVLSKAITGERRYDGPMGKSDRALLFGLLSMIWFWWPKGTDYFNYVLVVAMVLICLSTFTRLKKIL